MRIELAAAEKPPYTDEKEPNKKNNNITIRMFA